MRMLTIALLALLAPQVAMAADLPDPMERGPYTTASFQQYKAGVVNLQEPESTGNAAGATAASGAVNLQVRGSMYYPANSPTAATVILLVHGNHGGCQQGGAGGSAPNCTIFNRNDLGYSYLADNLASWGYAVASMDQDQLMSYQDNGAKGMHLRRLMMAAQLDALYEANTVAVPDDADHNIGGALVGKLDFSRVGLMGHSRGGDATTSFMDYNRSRPAPGRRYNVSAVISLAPVDYERRSPYGAAYLSILPACDGDVSNLQGARFYERGQRIKPGDPFPKIQQYVLGANHGNFNSVWSADSDDAFGVNDPACGADSRSAINSTSIRLSGGTIPDGVVNTTQKQYSFLATYERGIAFSPDPQYMGDQEKIGLATMSSFFRRYVGGEVAYDPYVTGELANTTGSKQIPATACPTSPTGTRIDCAEYVQTSYFAAAGERKDVIGPSTDQPLEQSELGTALKASGFANPYTTDGGISPLPPTTASGLDWCNPEPNQFTPVNVGIQGYPTANKGCPLPSSSALGGQAGRRENSPVNESYGEQLAAAWDNPVTATGSPATLETRIPAAEGDVSGLKSLALGAAVNFFDARNPARTGDALWNPSLTKQDFEIALTDASGTTGTVHAADRRYGTALQQTTGNATSRVHIVLNQVRVPLADFSAQGVDLTKVRKVAFRFGGSGYPATGSIQLADVRFQESAAGPQVLAGRAGTAAVEKVIADTPRDTVAEAGPLGLAIDTGGAAPAATSCVDPAPSVKLATKRLAKGRLALSGTATDAGCKPGRGSLKSVQVVLSVKSGTGCKFVKATGKLSGTLPCAAAGAFVAKGKGKWSLTTPKLPKGTFNVSVRAIDGAGNLTVKAAKAITVK